MNSTQESPRHLLKKELQQILLRQIGRLIDKNISQENYDLAFSLQDHLPERFDYPESSNCIPLLLVLSLSAMPFSEQLKLVEYGPIYGPAGRILYYQPAYSYLDMSSLLSTKVSDKPYLLIDVEDGRDTRGRSPHSARTICANKGRHAFSVEQCIALAVHFPQTFDEHNVHASDSTLEVGEQVFIPDFWVYGGKIKVKRDSMDDYDHRWGTPSYKTAITLD